MIKLTIVLLLYLIGINPVTVVVHGCTGRDVDMTVVIGEILVQDGRLADGGREREMEIVRLAQESVKGILDRCSSDREAMKT